MQIKLTESQIKELLGEIRFIGANIQHEYIQGVGYTDKIQAVTYSLGCSEYGKAIEIRVEQDVEPNIKWMGLVKAIDLTYNPSATVMNINGETRGRLVERFIANAIIPASKSEMLADENGEVQTEITQNPTAVKDSVKK